MTISIKDSPILPIAGVLLYSGLDSYMNQANSASTSKTVWNALSLGATAYCTYQLLDTPPNTAFSAGAIAMGSLAILSLSQAIKDRISSKPTLEAHLQEHVHVLKQTENVKFLPLNDSLIVLPKKDLPSGRSAVLPVIQTYLLSRAANPNDLVTPLVLSAARIAPCLISDFAHIPKEEDVQFLSRKHYKRLDPKDETFQIEADIILGIKLRFQAASDGQCYVCHEEEENRKKYTICNDPKHTAHYECLVEYIHTRWESTQIQGFQQTTTGGWAPMLSKDELPLCFCQQDPAFMKVFSCRSEKLQRFSAAPENIQRFAAAAEH